MRIEPVTKTILWTLLLTLALIAAETGRELARIDRELERSGTYCLRTGPHPSGLAMVSDDGGKTWQP